MSSDLLYSKDHKDFLENKLSSKLWRINNLYTIRDKNANKIILKLNKSQRKVVTQFKHNRKIILKSRQQGISTLFLAVYLDSCIFTEGFQAGIQSYGQDEAEKLSKRALLMWEDFDENIKQLLGITLVANNSRGMSFSNGSILKIGNFRGDTLQALHVSELGKIAKKYPEKAKELKTGAFQAVGKNNKITIESTAEGNSGMFYDMWKNASEKKSLSPFDFQPIFLSWIDDPDCTLDMKYEPTKELDKYFTKLETKLNIKLKRIQKAWYKYKSEELALSDGDTDMKQEYPSYPEEAFEQSIEGVILRKEYENIIKEDRSFEFKVDKQHPTYVSYDIGVNDETVLTFVQLIKGRPHIVYTYSKSRENLAYYIEIMRSLNFRIRMVYLPHDANVMDWSGTGRTRIEEFRRYGVPCQLIKRRSVKDYINGLRSFLRVAVIHNKQARDTLIAIQNYKWKYDKALGVYLQTPLHDIHSNFIDSLKYMAMAIPYSKTLGIYKKENTEPITDLWELNDINYNKSQGASYSV